MVVTVEKNGRERAWGPLSQATAWRAGCYREDMDGRAKVYLEKDQKRTEVLVEMTVKGGRQSYWLKEKKAQNQEEQQLEPQKDDSTTEEDPVTEEDPAMQEVSPEERRARK